MSPAPQGSPEGREALHDPLLEQRRTRVPHDDGHTAATLDRYSHVLPGMSDQTAAAMEAALS